MMRSCHQVGFLGICRVMLDSVACCMLHEEANGTGTQCYGVEDCVKFVWDADDAD